MLLQKLSPPNHVILLYRGDAEALLYRVSHSSPGLLVLDDREAGALHAALTLNFPQGSNLKLAAFILDCISKRSEISDKDYNSVM